MGCHARTALLLPLGSIFILVSITGYAVFICITRRETAGSITGWDAHCNSFVAAAGSGVIITDRRFKVGTVDGCSPSSTIVFLIDSCSDACGAARTNVYSLSIRRQPSKSHVADKLNGNGVLPRVNHKIRTLAGYNVPQIGSIRKRLADNIFTRYQFTNVACQG